MTDRLASRHSSWLIVSGRMRPGVNAVQAQAEMHVFADRLALEHPDSNKELDAIVYPATLVPGPYRVYVRAFTGLLMAVFALVLLIACANAASLLLARAASRTREMAIRSALGRGARAAYSADACRKPAPLVILRHRRCSARVVDCAAASPTRSAQPPHHTRGSSRLARAGVHRSGLARSPAWCLGWFPLCVAPASMRLRC